MEGETVTWKEVMTHTNILTIINTWISFTNIQTVPSIHLSSTQGHEVPIFCLFLQQDGIKDRSRNSEL